MDDRPGWIEILCKRYRAGHALHSAYLVNLEQEHIQEAADGVPSGEEQLREVALGDLDAEDPKLIEYSLICLSVVGRREDLKSVEPLLTHASSLVRRAARVCRFELKRL